MTIEVTTSIGRRCLQSLQRIESRVVIIAVPLVIITALSFAYMQLQSSRLQRAARTAAQTRTHTQATVPKNTTELNMVQPALPVLDTGDTPVTDTNTDQETRAEPDGSSIGPSSKNAGQALQGSSNNSNDNKNNLLQATRKAIKLEDLNL